jgi:hypothetical protein
VPPVLPGLLALQVLPDLKAPRALPDHKVLRVYRERLAQRVLQALWGPLEPRDPQVQLEIPDLLVRPA